MSTFFLTEEQFQVATVRSNGRKRARRLRILWRTAAAIVAALLIAAQIVLGQYIGAGIFVALLLAFLLPFLLRSRSRRDIVAARTKRLTSILYRVELDASTLELEYDRSIFRMSFDNLLITKRNPDFYVVHHELGPLAYIPVFALTPQEQAILDRHVSRGHFDWAAKNAKRREEA